MTRAGKTERGKQTRARVVVAATKLFCEQGYLDTTMAAIAAEAGVAVQTLYLAFGSKVAILAAAHDLAVVGDDEPLPLLERPWVTDVRAEPDGRRALGIVITNGLQIIERVGAIYGAIQAAAADAEVGGLLAGTKAQRLETMQILAAELATKAGFAADLSTDTAADVLYAIVSDELYRVLVIERHWSTDAWNAWAYDSVSFRLFPTKGSGQDGNRSRSRRPGKPKSQQPTARSG